MSRTWLVKACVALNPVVVLKPILAHNITSVKVVSLWISGQTIVL